MNNVLLALRRKSTLEFIVWASLLALLSLAFNVFRKIALSQGIMYLSSLLEFLGFSSFCVAYVALWALLVIGLFRPVAVFSVHGLLRQRSVNFACAAAALVALHVLLAFALATAAS